MCEYLCSFNDNSPPSPCLHLLLSRPIIPQLSLPMFISTYIISLSAPLLLHPLPLSIPSTSFLQFLNITSHCSFHIPSGIFRGRKWECTGAYKVMTLGEVLGSPCRWGRFMGSCVERLTEISNQTLRTVIPRHLKYFCRCWRTLDAFPLEEALLRKFMGHRYRNHLSFHSKTLYTMNLWLFRQNLSKIFYYFF